MFGIGGKKAVEGARSGLYAIYDRVAEESRAMLHCGQ